MPSVNAPHFGYAGQWTPSYLAAQEAARLVKNGPVPVGVETYPGQFPNYRVVSANEYGMAAQGGRLMYSA